MDENKKKALGAALMQIEKQFGKGSVMRMGDVAASRDIDVVSTGSLGLDIALGCGGLPRGRVVEIYGPESSGKTTLTLQVIAEMQKLGGTAAFVDAEHALDPGYAEKIGVNVDEFIVLFTAALSLLAKRTFIERVRTAAKIVVVAFIFSYCLSFDEAKIYRAARP